MKFKLSTPAKLFLVFLCLAASVTGFMIKLPSGFRHMDKELHSAFYFLAAAFFNLLFVKRNLLKHLLVFGLLYLFGMGIEYAQEYSNTFFHKRIHGRYDPEDIQSNIKGLIWFSGLWVVLVLISFISYPVQKVSENQGK